MGFIGSALGIVGGLMQAAAANRSNHQMGAAYRDEIARQGGYQNQATTALDPSIAGSDVGTANRQIAEGAQQRNQAYGQANAVPLGIPTASSQSNASDTAYNKMVGGQRAQLGGYSDWALKQAIQNIQTQRAMDQAINFAHGTAGVFPYRMYNAQHSADTIATLGKIVSSAAGPVSMMTNAPSTSSTSGSSLPAAGSGFSNVPYGTFYNQGTNQNMYTGNMQIPSFYQ